MTEFEKEMMLGMINLLNEARESYYKGTPIITDEQYDIRMKDLKQLEEETGCVLENSPTKNMININ